MFKVHDFSHFEEVPHFCFSIIEKSFLLKSHISLGSEFDIDMPQLVIFACGRKDKRSIYTIKSTAAPNIGSQWETPYSWTIQSELLPISPDGAQTPIRYLLGTIISHLICPDSGKGSSGQITVQVRLGFPLSKPQLKSSLSHV